MAKWPFKDITPNDITRFALQGRWDLVNRAASLASRIPNRGRRASLVDQIEAVGGHAEINGKTLKVVVSELYHDGTDTAIFQQSQPGQWKLISLDGNGEDPSTFGEKDLYTEAEIVREVQETKQYYQNQQSGNDQFNEVNGLNEFEDVDHFPPEYEDFDSDGNGSGY